MTLNKLKIKADSTQAKDEKEVLTFLISIHEKMVERINIALDEETAMKRVNNDTTKMIEQAVATAREIYYMKYPKAKETGTTNKDSNEALKAAEDVNRLVGADEDDEE
jgi:hypothetical protein